MKWIEEKNIDAWSDRLQAQSELPELIKDLVIASVELSDLVDCTFPSGNSINRWGYDGEIKVTASKTNLYIPSGNSVWECKTSKNYKESLKADLKKRTENSIDYERASTTIVLVTSRSWKTGDMESWLERQKEKYKGWKDIKCIDANKLEIWLGLYPAIAKKYAKTIRRFIAEDLYSIDEYWKIFDGRYSLKIGYSAPLASREKEQKELYLKLKNETPLIEYAADSEDEAKAFIIATIKSLENEKERVRLENKFLIAQNKTSLNRITDIDQIPSLIIVLPSNIVRDFMPLTDKHTLISVAARRIPTEPDRDLTRSRVFDLAESLAKDNPKKNKEEIELAAHECGGSLTILERRRPSSKNQDRPAWTSHTQLFMPAILAGAWSENKDADKDILEILSDKEDYEDFEEQFKEVLQSETGLPIDYTEPIFKMIAPIDALALMSQSLSTKRYKNLEKASLKVFDANENIEVIPDENTVYGVRYEPPNKEGYKKYSEWLSDGIANTLLQIANMHKELNLPQPPNGSHKKYVEGIIKALPGLRENINFIKSLERKLPYLMESSPDPFLEALEHLLKGSPNDVAKIFEAEEGFLSPNYRHTHLLWALEAMAWDPNYLGRVCLILTDLASITPEIKIINTPLNSLREILLPWHPSTYANSKNRLKVIDSLIEHKPDIAWELIIKLLPGYPGHASPTRKPVYRKSGEDKKEALTYGIIWDTWVHILKCAYQLAGDDPKKWSLILSRTDFKEIQREGIEDDLVKRLKFMIDNVKKPDAIKLWNYLRKFVYRNYAFPKRMTVDIATVEKVRDFLPIIEPDDLIEKNKWLFSEHNPDLPEKDFDKRREKLDMLRQKAVADIYNQYSIDGLIKLAESISQSSCKNILSLKCVEQINSMEEAINLIKENYGKNEDIQIFIMHFASNIKIKSKFDNWDDKIKSIIDASNWNLEEKSDLLLLWPHKRETWNFIENFGHEISSLYWRKQYYLYNFDLAIEDIEFAVNKLMDNNSFCVSVQAISEHAYEIKPAMILKSLKGAIEEINRKEHHDDMFSFYVEKIFSALVNRGDIDDLELAQMEFSYMNILKDANINDLSIYKIIRTTPSFYASMIDALYKKDSPNDNEEPNDEKIFLAKNAWEILDAFRNNDVNIKYLIDSGKLQKWSDEVIKEAKSFDKIDSAKFTLGQLIAHAPADPDDNIWPHASIRKLLEHLDSAEVVQSMAIEKANSAGVQSKPAFSGGDKSRKEAAKYRKLAQEIYGYPNTSKLYICMAEDKESWAKIEDKDAKLRQLKFCH